MGQPNNMVNCEVTSEKQLWSGVREWWPSISSDEVNKAGWQLRWRQKRMMTGCQVNPFLVCFVSVSRLSQLSALGHGFDFVFIFGFDSRFGR